MDLWSRPLSSREVAGYYDSWHDRYVHGFGQTFQSQRTDDLSDLFRHIAEAAELSPGQRVLDAGCGVGGPASWFAQEMDVEIHAITISSRQIEEARRHLAEAGLSERVQVTLGDFHHLENHYPIAFFDAALFLESFVHSQHPELVLRSVAQVLRPGGVLYVKDLFRRAEIPNRRERRRVRRVIRNVNRFFCLEIQPQKKILEALQSSGFQLEWFREMPIPTNHDIGNAFVAANGIDIYEGEPLTFLDWLELKAWRL